MLDGIRNLKVSRIDLRHRLPMLECDWLVARLRAHPGVARADCASDARALTVEYDADRLVSADLVDLLGVYGVRVKAVHRGH